jgi:hypothetical protein
MVSDGSPTSKNLRDEDFNTCFWRTFETSVEYSLNGVAREVQVAQALKDFLTFRRKDEAKKDPNKRLSLWAQASLMHSQQNQSDRSIRKGLE